MPSGSPPILMLGDSITAQWLRFRPRVFRKHGLRNAGVGGETTRQIRLRFDREVAAANPRGIHLLAGLNDIAENEGPVPLSATRGNLAWMIDQAVAVGCPVFVASVTPTDVLAWNPRVQPARAIVGLNEWLRDYAAAKGARYLDYHAALSTPSGALRPRIGPDGSHLDARGYRLIEPILLDAIVSAFGEPPRRPGAAIRAIRWLRGGTRD